MREHAVPCAICRTPTFADDVLCRKASCRKLADRGRPAVASGTGASARSGPPSSPVLTSWDSRGGRGGSSSVGVALPATSPVTDLKGRTASGGGVTTTRAGLLALRRVHERVQTERTPSAVPAQVGLDTTH